MGFSLSNILKQAVAQANPLDHGQTAATVRQQQQKQAPMATTGNQPPQPQNPLVHAFGNVEHAVGNLGHAAGNVGHAAGNTINALSAHSLNNHLVHPAIGLAQGVAAPFEYLGRTDIVNPARQLAAQFSHNTAAAGNAQLDTNRTLGLGDKGTNFAGGLRTFGGNVAQVGLDIAAPGAGKLIDKSFVNVSDKVAPGLTKQVTKTVVKDGVKNSVTHTAGKLPLQLVSNAGTGAVVGAPFNATSYIAGEQPLTRKGVVQSIKQGAQTGALLGAGGTATGAIVAKGAPIIAKGAVTAGKNVAKALDKTVETPAIRANLNDQSALHDLSDYLNGKYDPTLSPGGHNAVINGGHEVLAKHLGVSPGDVRKMTVGDKMDAISGVLDNLGKERAATSQRGAGLISEDGSTIPTIKKALGKGKPEQPSITAYHGSTNDKLTSLVPGAKTGLNEKRNLIYLTEDKKTAGDYAKARGTGGLGVLKDSPTGTVYPVKVNGKVLDAYDRSELDRLKSAPGYENLTSKTQNHITNDTGLSPDILEANPELTNFLKQNGVTAVRTHLPNGGGATQLAVINHDNLSLAKPTETALPTTPTSARPGEVAPVQPPAAAETGARLADESSTQVTPDGRVIGTNTDGSPIYQPGYMEPKVAKNALTKGGKAGRQNISPEVQAGISGEGFVRNTKQLQDTAVKNANKQGLNKTIQSAHEALAVAPGQITDETVAHVQQAIERADAAGRTQDAVGLHDALSEHLRKQGQTIQAASLLYKLSPNGLFYKGMRDIKTSGTTVTPVLESKLKAASEAIKAAPEGDAKVTARAAFHKLVADNLKQSNANKVLSVWKAGLLSSPLTHAGNFASNETFNALKNVSNPIASGVDSALTLAGKTKLGKKIGLAGERTKTATLRGIGSGTVKGIKESGRTIKTGIDARSIEGSKYELHGELNFKNPVVQKVFGDTSNGVFRLMSAGDQPVYYRNLKQNLYDLALADGKNKGLSGKQLTDHAKNLVANPTEHIAETAKLAAQKSVLSQDSPFASALSKFSQSHPALQAVVPFVKVPTNFLTRTLDFSPVGLGKAGYKVFADAKAGKGFDQRALSEAVGEGLTGTGIIAVGAMLANNNMLSGQYPSNDQHEVQRWKTEGIQPNSVKLGGKWVNLNYLGPVGLLLGAGKDYHAAAAQGNNGAMQAIAGFGKGLTGQSFLTGFSGAANAINDPGRYGTNFVHSQAASVVPAWLNTVGNMTDSSQRQANSTLDSIKSRVPGVRTSLPVKNDVYGNPLPQRTNPVDIGIDPLKPSNDLSQKNPVVSEVNRLHSVDPNNSDLQVTPTPITSVKIGKQQVKLDGQQRYDLQKQVGQEIQSKWGNLIQTDAYKQMNDVQKAAALNNIRSLATEDATRSYIVSSNLGTYNKPESKKAAALNQGAQPIQQLAASKATGQATSSPATTIPGNKRGTDLVTKISSMSTDGKKGWLGNSQIDSKYADVYDQAKTVHPDGVPTDLPDIPKTNAVLNAYATYLKGQSSKQTPLEQNIAKKTFLRDAYSSALPKNSQDLLGNASAADKVAALNSGSISSEDLQTAVAYDNFLLNTGLSSSAKISNTIRQAAGLANAPKAASGTTASNSGSKKYGTKSTGSSRSGGSASSKKVYSLYGTAGSRTLSDQNKTLSNLVRNATFKTKATSATKYNTAATKLAKYNVKKVKAIKA